MPFERILESILTLVGSDSLTESYAIENLSESILALPQWLIDNSSTNLSLAAAEYLHELNGFKTEPLQETSEIVVGVETYGLDLLVVDTREMIIWNSEISLRLNRLRVMMQPTFEKTETEEMRNSTVEINPVSNSNSYLSQIRVTVLTKLERDFFQLSSRCNSFLGQLDRAIKNQKNNVIKVVSKSDEVKFDLIGSDIINFDYSYFSKQFKAIKMFVF